MKKQRQCRGEGHGTDGKQQAEMGMKGMCLRDRIHKPGKSIPYKIFQSRSSYDQHFSAKFILVGSLLQDRADRLI